jgi:hypothetical protein
MTNKEKHALRRDVRRLKTRVLWEYWEQTLPNQYERKIMQKKKSKAKPVVTLDRVTYRAWVAATWPNDYYEHRRRFTVRAFSEFFALWDKKQADWLFVKKNHVYGTRAAAWRYLRTTTIENREYKLEMVNRALDGEAS